MSDHTSANASENTSQSASMDASEAVQMISALKTVTERLEREVSRLEGQIKTIESLTRENLPDFLEIFRKAKEMLEGCQHKFWMLSFTPAFGLVHTFDKRQLNLYWEDSDRSKAVDYQKAHDRFEQEVRDFMKELVSKARAVSDFRLATLEESNFIRQFRDSVIDKMGEDLFDSKVDASRGPSAAGIDRVQQLLLLNHKNVLRQLRDAEKTWVDNLVAEGGIRRDDLPSSRLKLMRRIPLQMFISDFQKQSCVVFFIGDFNVKLERRVTGFYSSQAPLVSLFEDIFKSNVAYFQKSAVVDRTGSKQAKNVPRNKGDQARFVR